MPGGDLPALEFLDDVNRQVNFLRKGQSGADCGPATR